MKHMLSALTALVLLAGSVHGQVSVVQNPSPADSFVEATAKLADGQSVTWFVSPEPTKQVEIDTTVYFNGPAGTYTVTALVLTVKDGKVTSKKYTSKVVIGDPIPPIPPIPPTPPTPIDAFNQAIQAAYTVEVGTDKATSTAKLASIYRMAAKNTVTDPTISTTAQLYATMKTASETLLPATAIPGVRKVVGTRLNPVFGTSTTLTTASRTQLAAEFNAIADALSSAK